MTNVTPTSTATRQPSGRRTTVALKIVMAVTGVLFVLFLLAHAYGNLKAFGGQASFDGYAEHLREFGYPILPHGGLLWILRVGLLASLVLHAGSAVVLWRRAQRARGSKYVARAAVRATVSSRTMRWGGVTLLAFIVFHILQFTTNTIDVGGAGSESAYNKLVAEFNVWWVVLLYLVALAALWMHLRHGVWSSAQTLGLSNRRRERTIDLTALGVATVVFVAFAVTPLAIFAGVID